MENEVYEGQIIMPSSGSEPVWTVGGITAFTSAVLVLLALFIPLPPGLDFAIIGVIAAGAPLVMAKVARNKVTANANVVEWATGSGMIVAGEANEILANNTRIRAMNVPLPESNSGS